MVEKEWKKMIFCQGDKKELEDITGDKYEYINPKEIKEVSSESHPSDYSKNTFPSFITLFVRDAGRRKGMREFYKGALQLDADAIIHYRDEIRYDKEGIYGTHYCYAIGTPLRRVK